MATGGGQPSAQRVTCAVCLERYRRPKLLSCFHTFCLTCLESLAPPPAPSLTCPQCRTVVPLPQGGAAQFKSNFYLEEELLSHVARKCDVCSESRDVEYRCVECQQYYCAPCRAIHDKITAIQRHTLLPFSLASAAQRDQREGTRRCPKHDFQRHIFFCKVCDVTICPHCKLTSHDGHVTEDLADAATKARQDLQTIMGKTQLRMRKLEILEVDTKKRKEKLLAEINSADDVIKKRASDVIVWAQQAREEALGRARELCHVTEDCLNQTLEATQHTMSSLTAWTDHVTAVLSDQDDTEVIQLLANITTSDPSCLTDEAEAETASVSEKVEQQIGGGRETSESNDAASYMLVHQESNESLHSAIITYVGHVTSTATCSATPAHVAKAAQKERFTSLAKQKCEEKPVIDLPNNTDPQEQAAEMKTTNDVEELSNRVTSSIAEKTLLYSKNIESVDPYTGCFIRQPLPQQTHAQENICYGSHPLTSVTAMQLTVQNRLWVKYKPPYTEVDLLKFFDTDGTELGTWRGNTVPKGYALTCVGETLLSTTTWQWIKPSGEFGSLDNAPHGWALCSRSLPPFVVLAEKKTFQHNAYKVHRLVVRSLHPLRVELVPLSSEATELVGRPTSFDAANCGTIFCFLCDKTVCVYSANVSSSSGYFLHLAKCPVSSAVSSSNYVISLNNVLSVCFTRFEGKDVLLVHIDSRNGSNPTTTGYGLLVLDHEDGFFVKFYQEGDEESTWCIAHNNEARVWLGKKGGKIQIRNMSSSRVIDMTTHTLM